MSKKRIIITAGAGLFSFAAAFTVAWFTSPTAVVSPNEPAQTEVVQQEVESIVPSPNVGSLADLNVTNEAKIKSLSEQQLKTLVHDIRAKIQEYENKLQTLHVREQRLQIAQDVLRKDIESLSSMQTELASVVANLKSERDKLIKSRLEILETERTNLIAIAATYDKMDATAASKILSNMCKGGSEQGGSGNIEDAVKILYYMTERAEAALLAEIANTEPVLAATLCQRLKRIVEVD